MNRVFYGLDIGGTKIEIAIFDAAMSQINSWRVATPKSDYEQFIQTITTIIKQADQEFDDQASIGIALPGIVDAKGCSISSNIPCINGQCVRDDLINQVGRQIVFENDMTAFVFSEANGGAGNGKKTLGVILGTGLGAGLCSAKGEPMSANGFAIEHGHISLPLLMVEKYTLPIRSCGCGSRGCAEAYLSGPGLLWLAQSHGKHYASASDLMQEVRDGDDVATEIFTVYLDCLAAHFADLVLILQPDTIVLGGGLSKIPELYKKLPNIVTQHLLRGLQVPEIVPPAFGDSSGVRGAAMLGAKLIR